MPRGGARPVRTNSENKAVSGPGSLSERTDMEPMGSGDVPQSQIPSVPVRQSQPVAPPQQLTNLFAPTERPDEPITAGASFGPGYTPPQEVTGRYKLISKYMPMLNEQASNPDAPDTFKNFVRFVNAANELDGIV